MGRTPELRARRPPRHRRGAHVGDLGRHPRAPGRLAPTDRWRPVSPAPPGCRSACTAARRGSTRPGSTATVPALRRVEVPALGELTGAQPIRYDTRRPVGPALPRRRHLARPAAGAAPARVRARAPGADAGSAANLAALLDDVAGMPSRRELARLVDPDRPAGRRAGRRDDQRAGPRWVLRRPLAGRLPLPRRRGDLGSRRHGPRRRAEARARCARPRSSRPRTSTSRTRPGAPESR